jgi:AraC-like DNA-binding protein
MRNLQTLGFTWQRRPNILPAVLTAVRTTRRIAGLHAKWKHPTWMMAYAYNEHVMIRVVSSKRPWEPRLARMVYLYPPNTFFWEKYKGTDNPLYHTASINFFGARVCGLAKLVHPRIKYARFLDPDGVAGTMFDNIARIGHEESEAGFWKAQSILCSLIDLLQRSEPVETGLRRIKSSVPVDDSLKLVHSVNDYLSQHLSEHVTLENIAKDLHVSVATLSHSYRPETNESPIGRLLRMRMSLAKSLIAEDEPLKVVAEETGFCDAFHLSKTFKRLEGMSPSAYLQSLRRAGH